MSSKSLASAAVSGVDGNIAALSVKELTAAIAAAGISPGAGAAGAVTLALAAACAGKAVAISLKHRPDSGPLRSAQAVLQQLGELALAGADRDASAFEAFIREHDPDATAELLHAGAHLAHLIAALKRVVDRIEPEIDAAMMGDVTAARALSDAARAIQRDNQREASAAAPRA